MASDSRAVKKRILDSLPGLGEIAKKKAAQVAALEFVTGMKRPPPVKNRL
jgi:hypothetical protein